MEIQELYEKKEYQQMSEVKKRAVEEIWSNSGSLSIDAALPLLLKASKALKESGEAFTKEETAFLLAAFTEKLTPEEKKKLSALLKLIG